METRNLKVCEERELKAVEVAERVLHYMKQHRVPLSADTISDQIGADWKMVRKSLRRSGFANQRKDLLWELAPHVPRLKRRCR